LSFASSTSWLAIASAVDLSSIAFLAAAISLFLSSACLSNSNLASLKAISASTLACVPALAVSIID
jgi:hypothetical protein